MNVLRFVGVTSLVVCFGTAAWGQEPLEPLRLDLDVSDMPVARALNVVGFQAQQLLDVDQEVDERVSLKLRSVRWRHALNEIAKAANCQIEERAGWIRLYQVPRVTYRCKDTAARTVFLELAGQANKSVVVAPDVTVSVNLEFSEVPYDEALARTAQAAGLQLIRVGECTVVSRAKLAPVPPLGSEPVLVSLADCAVLQGTLKVDLGGDPLSLRLGTLGRRLGVNLVVDQNLEARDPASYWGSFAAPALLEVLARRNSCDVEALGPGLFYFSQPVRISLAGDRRPLVETLLEFAAYGGKPVLLRPELHAAGQVSYAFHEVRFETGLRAVATAMGLGVHRASTGEFTLGRGALSASDPAWPRPRGDAGILDFEVNRLPLPQALARLGERAGCRLRVDPAADLTLNLALRGVTWLEALRVVAREADGVLQAEEDGSIRLALPSRLRVSSYAAPLPELLRQVGELAGTPVRVDPAIQGYVSAEIRVHGATLDLLASAYGLSVDAANGEVKLGWTAQAEALFAGPGGVRPPAREQRGPSATGRYEPPPGDAVLDLERTFAALESLARRQAQAWAGDDAGRRAKLKTIHEERKQVRERVLQRYLDGTRGPAAFPAGVIAFTRPRRAVGCAFDVLIDLDREFVLGTLVVGEATRLHQTGKQRAALKRFEQAAKIYTKLRRMSERDFERLAEVLYLRSKQVTELVHESLEVEQFQLRVSATCYTGESRTSVAILNGQSVRLGDRLQLEGVEEPLYVREIYPGGVNLRYKGVCFRRHP